ncbi:hypothetical protein ACTVZO_13565 [Streptomyces sp. IBSNAI002]|uniref:hypothetical protein n=1 Tax=Streptomyces sp. IBSNAI002 TaxID=3457500 RepID=UPI003FD13577
MAPVGSFLHEPHPWLGLLVEDPATGTEGELTAVVQEPMRNYKGEAVTQRRAFIRPKNGGIELPADLTNIELVPAGPPSGIVRRPRS